MELSPYNSKKSFRSKPHQLDQRLTVHIDKFSKGEQPITGQNFDAFLGAHCPGFWVEDFLTVSDICLLNYQLLGAVWQKHGLPPLFPIVIADGSAPQPPATSAD
ncbi:MAG: hypothetical protein LBB14_00470 [Puniceicoccales bacterium]|jgi:hypothetical protein|nr:hypothetical protein [Puniceicoccales bacterium]